MKKSSFNYLASQENTALLLMSLDSLLPWEYKFIDGLADECSKTDDWDRFTSEVVHTLGVHPVDGFKRPRYSHETVADFVSDLWQDENTYHTPDRTDRSSAIYNLRCRIEEDLPIPYGITPESFVQEWNAYCDYQAMRDKVNTWYIIVNGKVVVTADYPVSMTPDDVKMTFLNTYASPQTVHVTGYFDRSKSTCKFDDGFSEMTLKEFEQLDYKFRFFKDQTDVCRDRLHEVHDRIKSLYAEIDRLDKEDLPNAKAELQGMIDKMEAVACDLGYID